MGGGIWAMHFIGMLAFPLPCGVDYNPVGTLLSMIPGGIASGIALTVISKRGIPSIKSLLGGAVLMGGGIGAMHYAGMAAMQPQALLLYDPVLVGVSVVVAIVLAFVMLVGGTLRACWPVWLERRKSAVRLGGPGGMALVDESMRCAEAGSK